MTYEYITKYTSPNVSPGRPAGRPDGIVIHYWNDPKVKPKWAGVISWLLNPKSQASAHYVAEAGRVACLVAPKDRAWHAGPLGNPRKIGIECNPRMSQGDLETTAELIADLRKAYGNLPLSPHNAYMSTSCPGSWQSKLAWLNDRANTIMKNQGTKPNPNPPPAAPGKLALDQYWGRGTTLAAQRLYDTPQDSIVSSQPIVWKKQYGARLTTGWEWANQGRGSQLIKEMQKRLKAKGHRITALDGLAGPEFWAAFTKEMGGNNLTAAIGNFQIRLNQGWK